MDYNIAYEFQADRPDRVVYSCAGKRRALPVALVREIGQAATAEPVPFAAAGFEGLVESDGILAAQLDLSLAMGGPAGGGRYSVLVESSQGLLRLRVDGVSFAGPAAEDGVDSGLDEIEALVASLAPADPLPEVAPPRAAGPAAPVFEALIVRSGGKAVALPAAAVERVERHRGARASRKGGVGERIVAVEDAILPGWSLAAWLDGAGEAKDGETAAGEEGWAVVVRVGGRRAALTVAEVRGVVAVPGGEVRRIRHRDGASVWLPAPGQESGSGMIEVIEPAEFGGSGHAHAPDDATAGDAGPDEEPAVAPAERRAADRGRFALDFGRFSCVVPECLIAGVLGEVGPDRLASRRGRGLAPLLDPAPLLGLAASGAECRRALVLKRPGRCRLALRVGAVAPAAPEPAWRPLPMLPPSAHRLFEAVRFEGSALAFLLRESAFDRPRDPLIAGLLRAAPVGWLGGF